MKISSICLRFGGAALCAGALLIGGCAQKTPVEPVAVAAQSTPKPKATAKPTPRPLPTHTPTKTGVALFGIKTQRKVFALTFDDGPDPTYTPQVLKILKAKNAPATFFMVGKMVRAHGSTAKLVKDAGFPIGGHSWSHPMRSADPIGEIDRTDKILKSTLGLKPVLFRPPYGILRNGLAAEASRRGQDVILWTSTANDWNKKNSSEQIKINVLTRVAPGGIALMHDGGGDRAKTVAALPGIIDTIRARGYQLVTVSELLAMGPADKANLGARKNKHHKTKITHPKR